MDSYKASGHVDAGVKLWRLFADPVGSVNGARLVMRARTRGNAAFPGCRYFHHSEHKTGLDPERLDFYQTECSSQISTIYDNYQSAFPTLILLPSWTFPNSNSSVNVFKS